MKLKLINLKSYIPQWVISRNHHTDILLRMIGFRDSDSIYVLNFEFEYKMKDFTIELHLKSKGKQEIECVYGVDEEYCEAMTEISNKGKISNTHDLIFMYNIINDCDIDFKSTAKLDVEYYLLLKNDRFLKKDNLYTLGLNSQFENAEEFIQTFSNNAVPNLPRIIKEVFKNLDINDYLTIDEQISIERIESQNTELKQLLGE